MDVLLGFLLLPASVISFFAIHRVLDRVSCVLEGSFVLGTNLAEGVMNLLLRWLINFKKADKSPFCGD